MTEQNLKDIKETNFVSSDVEQSLERRDIAFEALFRLFEKIGTTFDLETIIKLLLMTVVGQLGLRRVAFFLRKEGSGKLTLYHSIGMGREKVFPAFSLDSSFMGWMDRMDGVALIDDFLKVTESRQGNEPSIGDALVKSGFSYTCDLKEGDELFGIMAFSRKVSGQGFSDFDRELLVMMARVAAITIRNASLYQSVLRSRNELEKLVRMKKEFIDHTSHELRTPITVLRSSLWSIEAEADDGILLEMARDSVLKLEEKIETILSLNEMDVNGAHIEPLDVDIPGLVAGACGEIAEALDEKQIALDIRNAIEMEHISVDPVRMKIVIRNLLDNSVEAVGSKGGISIELSECIRPPGGEDGVEISAWDAEKDESRGFGPEHEQADSWIVIRIADDGRGIPANEITIIGKPFERASNSAVGEVKGLGVGLSIAQKIVAAHGGFIFCKSVENEGAEFSIWLPVESGSPESGLKEH